MKQLVFLLGSYYPNFSAVGYCVHQVVQCLKHDFEVTVIAFRNESSQPIEELYEGVRILRIETMEMRERNLLSNAKSRSKQLGLKWLRARGALRRLLSPETVDHALVKAYEECLSALHCKPDVLIPVVFPFETVLAAMRYKENDLAIKLVPYLFDDFVESGSLHVSRIAARLKQSRHLSLEHEMLLKANAVLSMHPLQAHFEKNFERSLTSKITYLEHPLLKQPQESFRVKRNDIIKLCFTGSLIRNVREPSYLIKLLQNINLNTKAQVDFYVMGNAANQIKSEAYANSITIINHGRVSKVQADEAIQSANILINIGEAKGKQVSSKIFEYISTGKPIIHLAYTNNDVVSGILSKYPLSLCLIQDELTFNNNLKAFSYFCEQKNKNMIPYKQIRFLYPEAAPEHTSTVIVNIICNQY